MSVVDTRAVLSLLLNEQFDSVLPSDGTGTLPDFDSESTTTLPTVVDANTTGYARLFVSDDETTLYAVDSADALNLTRDVTIIALLYFDIVLQDAYGNDGTVIQRGESGTIQWRLMLSVVSASAREVKMYLAWDTESGSNQSDVGVEFTWPSDESLLVGAVREVIDGTFVCRYHVNGQYLVGGSHSLDVYSSSGETVWVGARSTGGSPMVNFLNASLEALEVYPLAISIEEFEWTWRRMSEDIPAGIRAIRALVPPGAYSNNPDSVIQRELHTEGSGIGVLRSQIVRLKDYFLPDKAWGEILERWESITKLSPKAGDSLSIRRERITSFLGTVRGFAVGDVKAVLEESFDLVSADIEIIEYDNDYTQDFASDPGDYITDDSAATSTFESGVLKVEMDGHHYIGHGMQSSESAFMIWNVADELNAWIAGKIAFEGGDDETMGCLCVGNRATDEWLFWGTDRDFGIRYATYLGGVFSGWTLVDNQFWPVYVRILCLGEGNFELRFGDSAANADSATPLSISGGPQGINWAGFVGTFVDDDSHFGICTFDDLLIHAPNGGQRYNWYAYRDPLLPGNPDMIGGNLVVKRIKPAHTHAAAISQQFVLCDDTEGGCDNEPIGL